MPRNLVRVAMKLAKGMAFCACNVEDIPCLVHEPEAWGVWHEACRLKELVNDGNVVNFERATNDTGIAMMITAGLPVIYKHTKEGVSLSWGGDRRPVLLHREHSELSWRFRINQERTAALISSYASGDLTELPIGFLKTIGADGELKKCMDGGFQEKQETPELQQSPRKKNTRRKSRCRPGAQHQSEKAKSLRQDSLTMRTRIEQRLRQSK